MLHLGEHCRLAQNEVKPNVRLTVNVGLHEFSPTYAT